MKVKRSECAIGIKTTIQTTSFNASYTADEKRLKFISSNKYCTTAGSPVKEGKEGPHTENTERAAHYFRIQKGRETFKARVFLAVFDFAFSRAPNG